MRLVAIIITLLWALSSSAQLFVTDSIAALFADRALDPVEGVWQWPDDGAVILISRHTASSFTITLLDSPRPEVPPGKVIGKLISAPELGHYDCRLQSSSLGAGSPSSNDCHVSISDSDFLIFSPYRRHDSLSIKRLIPYMFRLGLVRSSRPNRLDGPRRIYPPSTPLSDIIL